MAGTVGENIARVPALRTPYSTRRGRQDDAARPYASVGTGRVDDCAFFHDVGYVLDSLDVVKRVAIDRHEIGELPRLDAASDRIQTA